MWYIAPLHLSSAWALRLTHEKFGSKPTVSPQQIRLSYGRISLGRSVRDRSRSESLRLPCSGLRDNYGTDRLCMFRRTGGASNTAALNHCALDEVLVVCSRLGGQRVRQDHPLQPASGDVPHLANLLVQRTSPRPLLGAHRISSPPASADTIIRASPYEKVPVRACR